MDLLKLIRDNKDSRVTINILDPEAVMTRFKVTYEKALTMKNYAGRLDKEVLDTDKQRS